MTSPQIHGQRVELPASSAGGGGSPLYNGARPNSLLAAIRSALSGAVEVTSAANTPAVTCTGPLQADAVQCLHQSLLNGDVLFDDALDLDGRKAIADAARRTVKFDRFQVDASDRHFEMLAAIATNGNTNTIGISHKFSVLPGLEMPFNVKRKGGTASLSPKGGTK